MLNNSIVVFLCRYLRSHSQSPKQVNCQGVSCYHFAVKTFITFIFPKVGMWWGTCPIRDVMRYGNLMGNILFMVLVFYNFL